MQFVMTVKNIIQIGLISFVLQSCSGVTVSQDYEKEYEFSALKTFSWMPNEDNKYGIKDNDLVDNRVRSAIEKNLITKSYRLIESPNPDFFISYHLTVEQKITSDGASGGVSIGRSSRGRYGGSV